MMEKLNLFWKILMNLQATQKQSSEGVSLGEDVLTLRVEADVDQSLVMALFTVYALINNKL